MAQPLGLAALDAIVNGVERPDRVRQHLSLHAHVLSPGLLIRSSEGARIELQAAENGALSNTTVEQDLPLFVPGWSLREVH